MNSKTRIPILLVDDHPIFLKGLCSLLEDETDMEVVGEAGDGQAALDLIKELSPSIVVMDINMPALNGIEATKHIASKFPETKVIALSIHSEKEFVQGMLQAGASGYIVKESVPEELVKGIRIVMGGEAYLSPVITGLIVSQFRQGRSQEQSNLESNIEIIETKLEPHTIPEKHVHRLRLLDLLERNRQLPLQNVVAPAGYGKSILVSCWLKNHEFPSAWISLDSDDNDLYRFVNYFVYAIQSIFPKTLMIAKDFMNASSLPPIQVMAGRIVNELNQVEQDFVIVLDDFHLIKTKKIHDLLVEILLHPPKQLHLVIIGRSDPFLPLAKLRAKGQLSDIRLKDLRFTKEEIKEFITGFVPEKVDDNYIAKLTQKTEGWITGLRLVSISMRSRNDLDATLSELEGSTKYVMEYLFNEVFSSLPTQIKDILLKTAILDRFCASLCNALVNTGDEAEDEKYTDPWSFINLLRKDNIFIFEFNAEQNWFRYHPLFQQLLQNQLKRNKSSSEIAELHGRASRWYYNEGFLGKAVNHAFDAGDEQLVIEIIEQKRHAVLNEDHWNLLKKWLDKLPDNIKQARYELLLCECWVLLMQSRLGEISPVIERIEIILEEKGQSPEIQAEICFFQGLLCYFQGKGEQSVSLLNRAVEKIPEKGFEALFSQTEYWACMALHMIGQKEAAISRLRKGINKRNFTEGMVLSRLRFGLCFVHMLDAEWENAFQAGRQLMEISKLNHLVFPGAWAVYVMGNTSLQEFNLEKAQKYFHQAVEKRYIKNRRAALDSIAGLAMTWQLGGNPYEADKTIQLAIEFAKWTKNSGNLEAALSVKARIDLLRGDIDSAIRWQKMLNQTASNQLMLFYLEIPAITECRVLIAMRSEKSLEMAREKLEDLRSKVKAWQNTCQMIEIMILQSLALYHLTRTDEALEILEKAVTLSEPKNWIRPFVESGRPMEEMLNRLLKKEFVVDFINKIFAASSGDMSRIHAFEPIHSDGENLALIKQPGFQTLEYPLTKREVEIMKLLAQHLYNKEIADKLYISPETVKTHLKKIYEKLEVGTRRDAVTKAFEIGLISS